MSDAKQKSELLSKIHKLEDAANTLQRDIMNQLFNRKSEFRLNYSALEDLSFKLATQRRSEQQKIIDQIKKIRAHVQLFQDVLKSGRDTYEQNFVEKLKAQMELTESAILAFKTEQRGVFESLMQNEKTLAKEVNAHVAKIESWTAARPASPPAARAPRPAARVVVVEKDAPKEIAQFERFEAQHGRSGGWELYEHGVFLKLRKRFHADPKFIDAVVDALPGLTQADVISHEQWFDEHEYLAEAKKAAIAKWRSEKEEQRQAQAQVAVETSETDTAQADAESAAKAAKAAKAAAEEKERAEKKAKIEQWRAERAEREAARANAPAAIAEDRHSAGREVETARRAEIREKVAAYKDQRTRQQIRAEEQARLAEATKPRVRSEDLEVLRALDTQRMEQRRTAARQGEVEAAQRAERLARLKAKVEVTAVRDPARLLRPTVSMLNRAQDDTRPSGRVLEEPPRMAVPSWRAGL